MPDISAYQRARAKAAAASAAVASNDAAVVLGVSGVVVAGLGVASGVGALAGVAVGGTLAVCSFGAVLIANRYQRLANDPPRQDFDQVSESFARLIEQTVPAEEPLATVHRLAAHQVILADALTALLTSLERYDGALEADDRAAADRQAEAVRHNAQVAIGEHDLIVAFASAVNVAWSASQEFVAWDSVSLAEVQDFYQGVRGEDPSTAPGDPLAAVLASVVDLADGDLLASLDLDLDPVLAAVELPAQPQILVNSPYLDLLSEVSAALGDLVTDET